MHAPTRGAASQQYASQHSTVFRGKSPEGSRGPSRRDHIMELWIFREKQELPKLKNLNEGKDGRKALRPREIARTGLPHSIIVINV